jgi:L-lactate dehydrogenase complex protein LldG
MKTEATSRAEILRRIRAANGAASDAHGARGGWDGVPREYKRKGTQSLEAMLQLLEDRLRDYDATVIRSGRENLAMSVARRLEERGMRRIVIPAGLSAKWLPEGPGFVVDEGFTAEQLNEFDGVLTGATIAIAETGTVVLQHAPGQGRRAVSLIPDYHLCVVAVGDVVETVPEAMSLLQTKAALPTTFISGPSATADIEMTRIKGVHGPRILDVILFG